MSTRKFLGLLDRILVVLALHILLGPIPVQTGFDNHAEKYLIIANVSAIGEVRSEQRLHDCILNALLIGQPCQKSGAAWKKIWRGATSAGLGSSPAVVRLLDMTLIRVGNEKYAKANRSYGLTTLRTRHTEVKGDEIHFQFRGKSGIDHDVRVSDPRVARIVKRCLEIPGQELFQWLDADGRPACDWLGGCERYLKEIAAEDFSAKDYRTWAGSVGGFRPCFTGWRKKPWPTGQRRCRDR